MSRVDIGRHFQMKFELQTFGNDTAENGSSKVWESVKYLPTIPSQVSRWADVHILESQTRRVVRNSHLYYKMGSC